MIIEFYFVCFNYKTASRCERCDLVIIYQCCPYKISYFDCNKNILNNDLLCLYFFSSILRLVK